MFFGILIYCRRTGVAPVGDLEQSRKWIHHWVAEFGLLGPLSNDHALEVFTDSEKAVARLIWQADVGRPVKIQKAPPHGHATIGAAAQRHISLNHYVRPRGDYRVPI